MTACALPASTLKTIPYVDLRGRFSPLELALIKRREARILLSAIKDTFGAASNLPAAMLLRMADRASRRWLKKADNPYLWEIDRLAEQIAVPGVYTVNVCLEWGCTSGVWNSPDGPLLRRVLDWPFPKLGEQVISVHLSGRGGSYYNITWPGLSGVFQGLAPGRFACAINQAPMRRIGAGNPAVANTKGAWTLDWALGKLAFGRTYGLPPGHLLRQVFELAPDYGAARELLTTTELAVPAIFALAGLDEDEGCVIERTETAATVREMHHGRVCATNHFEAPPEGDASDWRPRPIDSQGKYAQACGLSCEGSHFDWFVPLIANANSRMVFAARPRSGRLSLMGTEGPNPVTEIFRLPQES